MTFQNQPLSDEELATRLSQPLVDDAGFADSKSTAAQTDVETLHAALKNYRGQTLQWAERRSAGQPSLAARAHRQQRWAALPRWSMALVAVVTITGGVAHLASTRPVMEQPTVMVGAAAERASSPTDIAADNQLLSSIDAELSYHAHSPVDSLQLQSTQAGTTSGVTD